MKITKKDIKKLIIKLGFSPEENMDNVYFKKYKIHSNYVIKIDFNLQKIIYRQDFVPKEDGIKWGDRTTSNFENSENFVVLECVNRLLEKGYKPESIFLEYKFRLGRNEKGKLDILVLDDQGKPYLMIECKTWGLEFSKEEEKMQKDGGQLFSYFVQDKSTHYLCLYTSRSDEESVEYNNKIIKVDKGWNELNNQKEIYDHWNKNFKDNGIFDRWANAYNVEIKALVRGRLLPLTKDDSGRIFNQFAEILRHNVVSDKPNAFNKILNLFICKIIDEDKNDYEQVEFQWFEDDTNEKLQLRLNDLYKKGMRRFLNIDVTDYTEEDITETLISINDSQAQKSIRDMIIKLRLQKNPEFAFMEVYDETSFDLNSRVVKEVVELLQPYQFRYGHKQQFLGDFFEKLLNTSIKQESGQFFTPTPIAQYIVSSLPIREFIQDKIEKGENEVLPSVIDFACGTGHFLTEYMDKVQTIIEENINVENAKPTLKKKLNYWSGEDGKFEWASDYVYGIDADYRLVKSSKINSFLNGDGEANIIRANGLDSFHKSKDYRGKLKMDLNNSDMDNGEFDILIANPPYSVNAFKSTVQYGNDSFELFNKLKDSSSEIECLFVERMKQLLKIGGYAGIVLPSSILNNIGIYIATREIILKYFNIIGITEFGSKTFMATGTNTVALFLERRSKLDHINVKKAISNFFEKMNDVTVLGIEKAFSSYIATVFESVTIKDYITFINGKPNEDFCKHEIYKDYIEWFKNSSEFKKIKRDKSFNKKTNEEQQDILNNLFNENAFSIEKDKMLYFFLTYKQKTVITKTGEKQNEIDFLGYEFSNRRGHEGIKMLPNGTKLYDEEDPLNLEKANSYVYNAFMKKYEEIDENISNNISIVNTNELIDFKSVNFVLSIDLRANIKLQFESQYPLMKLDSKVNLNKGVSYDKIEQVHYETNNIILTADNITLDNQLSIVKKIFLKDSFIPNESSILKKDDIFICLSSGSNKHIGKVSYISSDMDYYAGGFMGIIRKKLDLDDDVSMKYIYSILSSDIFRNYISEISKGKGPNIKNLNDSIGKIKIPFPPINVQNKITSEIEKIEFEEIEKTKKIADIKMELLNPEFFSYNFTKVEKVAIMIKRGKTSNYGDSNIRIIKSGQARGFNCFNFTNIHYVSKKFVSDERNLQRGDILINSTGVGTAGRVTLFDLEGDYVVDTHITIVRLNKSLILPKYMLYALANIGFKNIEEMANGQSGQVELSIGTIKSLQIPLPSIEEQVKIIKQIEEMEKKMRILEYDLSGLKKEKQNILLKHLK